MTNEEMQLEKLKLENDKLRLEIDKCSCWGKNVKELITILPLLLSVSGNAYQGIEANKQIGLQQENQISQQKKKIAHDKEQEGYQKMIESDFEGARESFKEAENAVNGYHNVYELANLLRGIKNEEMKNDPIKRKEIIENVISQDYATPKQIQELRKLEN